MEIMRAMVTAVGFSAALLLCGGRARATTMAWSDFISHPPSVNSGMVTHIGLGGGSTADVTISTAGGGASYVAPGSNLDADAPTARANTGLSYLTFPAFELSNNLPQGGGTGTTKIQFSNFQIDPCHQNGYLFVGDVSLMSFPLTLSQTGTGTPVSHWVRVGQTFQVDFDNSSIVWTASVGTLTSGNTLSNDSQGIVLNLGSLRGDSTITITFQQLATDGLEFSIGEYSPQGAACTTVSANKDFQNSTGSTVNDIEWLIKGSFGSVLTHYDGPFPGQPNSTFSTFSLAPSGTNTLLHWSGGASIPAGGFAHVGFTLPAKALTTVGVSWTLDGVFAGCAHQVSIRSDDTNLTRGSLALENTATNCEQRTLYVGNVSLEWLEAAVLLSELKVGGHRRPIRVDPSTALPAPIPPLGELFFPISSPPPGAGFVTVQYTVGADPALAGPGNTVDFIQLALPPQSQDVPTLGRSGAFALAAILATLGCGFFAVRKRRSTV